MKKEKNIVFIRCRKKILIVFVVNANCFIDAMEVAEQRHYVKKIYFKWIHSAH